MFSITFFLLSLLAISSCGPIGSAQIPLDLEKLPLKLDIEDFPTGWIEGGVSSETEWGYLTLGYKISYGAIIGNKGFHSRLVYRQYNDSQLAQYYYEHYSDSVFYQSSNSPWISRALKEDLSAEIYKAMCTELHGATADRLHCSYWGKYDNCLIQFESNINSAIMDYRDFDAIISSIDETMITVADCNE